LRTKYNFKPENGDTYLTLYFENGSNDVIIDTNIEGIATSGNTNLTDVLTTLVEMIQNRALITVYDTAKSLKRKDIVLAQGQFGIESDTLQIKIGNGITPWNYLPYAISNQVDNDKAMVVVNDSSKISTQDEHGDDINVDLTTLRAATEAPEGARAFVKIMDIENNEEG
jgi:hypothetical protein